VEVNEQTKKEILKNTQKGKTKEENGNQIIIENKSLVIIKISELFINIQRF